MIKFGGKTRDGKANLIGIALGEKNIERLLAGQPITFKAEDVGVADVDVIIIAGKSADGVLREFAQIAEATGVPTKDIDAEIHKAGFRGRRGR